MSTMTPIVPEHWTELRNNLSEKINAILKDEQRPIRQAQQAIQVSQDALHQLRQSLPKFPFANLSDQVRYYKEIEPFFAARVIFFTRILLLETGRPLGDRAIIEGYLHREWQHIHEFHTQHSFLCRYILADETWLDEKLFVSPGQWGISEPNPHLLDPLLHNATGTIALFHAHELMQEYLLTAEEELHQPRDRKQRNIAKLTWTDSKSALIELAYAIQSAGSFNDRKADLREIIECFQTAFHIDLGHYPRVFQEILSRKTGYTTYIDRLRDKLLLRIKLIEDKYDRK
jgi:RteC protein